MKLIRYIKETTSYKYEIKFFRFHIPMKEFIGLLKNKIPPSLDQWLMNLLVLIVLLQH